MEITAKMMDAAGDSFKPGRPVAERDILTPLAPPIPEGADMPWIVNVGTSEGPPATMPNTYPELPKKPLLVLRNPYDVLESSDDEIYVVPEKSIVAKLSHIIHAKTSQV